MNWRVYLLLEEFWFRSKNRTEWELFDLEQYMMRKDAERKPMDLLTAVITYRD